MVGASGYTGRAVVRELLRRRVEVIAHVRPDSPYLEHCREEFAEAGATVDTTPWKSQPMRDALERARPSHVFSLLGTTRARARTARGRGEGAPSYDSVDYGLTALLIEACAALHPPPRFIYLSASGVPTLSARPPLGSYYRARWKAEQDLDASGLRAVIARPGFITGGDREEFRPLERLGALLLDAALRIAGATGLKGLRERHRSFTAAELAEALVSLALTDRGGLFHGGILRRYVRGGARTS